MKKKALKYLWCFHTKKSTCFCDLLRDFWDKLKLDSLLKKAGLKVS